MEPLDPKSWQFEFEPNVHMYCHRLMARNQSSSVEIPCEDTPTDFVIMWIYDLPLDKNTKAELLLHLKSWADQCLKTYRIYFDRQQYITKAS